MPCVRGTGWKRLSRLFEEEGSASSGRRRISGSSWKRRVGFGSVLMRTKNDARLSDADFAQCYNCAAIFPHRAPQALAQIWSPLPPRKIRPQRLIPAALFGTLHPGERCDVVVLCGSSNYSFKYDLQISLTFTWKQMDGRNALPREPASLYRELISSAGQPPSSQLASYQDIRRGACQLGGTNNYGRTTNLKGRAR